MILFQEEARPWWFGFFTQMTEVDFHLCWPGGNPCVVLFYMRRRIFIAVNLPEDIRKKIIEMQYEFSGLPIRFTKKNSLHLTILFIGYVSDEEMLKICQLAKEVARKHRPFVLLFNRIKLGPPNKPPRLVWLEGEPSSDLAKLKEDLENSFLDKIHSVKQEKRPLIPHITLARIRQMEWKKLPEQPAIDKEISLSVPVSSIEVMESELRNDGAEYVVLESAALGE